jgi:hypothetical protein
VRSLAAEDAATNLLCCTATWRATLHAHDTARKDGIQLVGAARGGVLQFCWSCQQH